jgi:ferric-dicitrate binding protein FerR (iron transport regulator)
MEMEDSRLMRLIALKLSGEAKPEDLKELEDLLMKDQEAGYSLEILQSIWNPATNLGEESNTGELFRTHREKYAADFDRQYTPEKTRRKRTMIAALVSTVLILIAGGILLSVFLKRSGNPGTSREQITVKKGSRSKVLLPDSTEVWLNSGSTLTYDPELKNERSVSLDGEGYFVVRNNKDQPFVIHTEKISIRVLGTEFNVRAYDRDRTTEATLIRGKIEVSMNSAPDKKLILNPHERFTVTGDPAPEDDTAKTAGHTQSKAGEVQSPSYAFSVSRTAPVEVGNKLFDKDTCWLHNQLIFKNETFGNIIKELEKKYDAQIELKNSKLESWRFTTILENESLQEVLKAMQLIKPFTYTITSSSEHSGTFQKVTIN